ncbi:short chain dehydrogenase domain-containing protein [Ditylenchus destructor]|uniref:Short chain dehydrogenase domain-containing protein n=1 Tax=Ditylenchus destructor TaxID=166010 RepID=A0AAD4MDL0_9BILA|nr:short chain dehydrogenase domain-containing protein [Ditylenchus destructor]
MTEVALVTGGARRIGRAIVERLADAGYAVAIHHGSGRGEAQELANRLTAAGRSCGVFQADLADAEAVRDLLPSVEAALGPVTLLVNNASSFVIDDVRSLGRRNLGSSVRGQSAGAVPADRRHGRAPAADANGAVVNIVDQRVWKLTPQYYSYTLTKAALLTATVTLASAGAASGSTPSAPARPFPNPHDGQRLRSRKRRRRCSATASPRSEIAEAVLYLAHARSVTGQMIAVDAGQHLGWRTPDIVG